MMKPFEPPSVAGGEQRAHIRWRGDAPHSASIEVGDQIYTCGIKDISAGGVALTRDFDAEIGQRVIVGVNATIRLPGTVVRVSDRIAVMFDIPEALAEIIDQSIHLGLSPAEW